MTFAQNIVTSYSVPLAVIAAQSGRIDNPPEQAETTQRLVSDNVAVSQQAAKTAALSNIVTSYSAPLPAEAAQPDLVASQTERAETSASDQVFLSQQAAIAQALNRETNTASAAGNSDAEVSDEKVDNGAFSAWSRANQDKIYTLEQLKSNWLAESERMVEKYYGLSAKGENTLTVRFNDNPNVSYMASVSYSPEQDDNLSRATNQVLTLVSNKFAQGQDDNGAYKPFYGDRIVAHEMVHAIMGQTMDMDSLGEWFKEGAAELLHGGDERLLYQLSGYDGDLENGYSEQDVANFANDTQFFDQWNGSSAHYAQGYLAVRFMHQDIVSHGGQGIKDVMSFLSDEKMLATGNATINNALTYLSYQGLSSYSSEAEFKTAFQQYAASYINNLDLTNDDTGAIGGFDVDQGEIKNAETVVDNSIKSPAGRPLKGYREVIFPETPGTFTAYS